MCGTYRFRPAGHFCRYTNRLSTYKASRGGKGVGRFLWLVAFEYANIESHYQDGNKMVTRSFRFSAQGDGISELSCAESDHATPLTIVTLAGFIEKYRRQCPRKLDTIAAYIIEYCLEYFIRPNCPTITLNEDAIGESLSSQPPNSVLLRISTLTRTPSFSNAASYRFFTSPSPT